MEKILVLRWQYDRLPPEAVELEAEEFDEHDCRLSYIKHFKEDIMAWDKEHDSGLWQVSDRVMLWNFSFKRSLTFIKLD